MDLLEHVGRALTISRRADLSRDALRFTFSLYVATRSLRQRDLRAIGLRVPTKGGWRPATEAFFSPGWGTPLGAPLARLIDRASASSSEIAAVGDLLLNEPHDWPNAVEDRDGWRAFLIEIGVRDGLWPRPVEHGNDPTDGGHLRPQSLARRFGLTPADAERWVQAVTASQGWVPNHPYTPYRPRDAVSVLPGQAEYEALDHRARALFSDLVAAGLDFWPTGTLEIAWYRFRHPGQIDERRWPSPILAFLHDVPWLPVNNPGQRHDESFVAPHVAWYFAESRGEEMPYFSPLVAGHLRRGLSVQRKALTRLKQLGMGDWGDVNDAPRLLHHLAGLVEKDALLGTGMLAFRRAYEDGWSRAAELGPERFVAEVGDLPVVVESAGQLTVRRPSDRLKDRLYLLGQRSSLAARALEASELQIVRVDSKDEGRVRPLLKALFRELLVTVEELDIDVVTDAGSFTPDGSGELLINGNRRWLDALISLILETRRSAPEQLGPRRRREVLERLRRVRRVETSFLELCIGSVTIDLPERQSRVVPLDHQDYPTLIVASPATRPQPGLEDLIAIARPLCELLGIVQCEDPLLLALERLHTQRCLSPTDDDFARILEIDPARVAEVRSHLGSSLDTMLHLLVPLVAYHVGVPQALALRDARGSFETKDDLRIAVSEVASPLPGLEQAMAASQEVDSLSRFRDALGLDYERFNAVLRALGSGYEPILNYDGHLQAMDHYIQINRSRLLIELRRRYMAIFREGASLDTYVSARELVISPNPAWLEAYDLPPEHLLETRIVEWLSEHGTPAVDANQLPDIDQARAKNNDLIVRIGEATSRLIPAWARKHRAPLPAIWTEEKPTEQLLSLAIRSGFMDFKMLEEVDVVAWLADRGWWPNSMPRTLIPSELELNEADLETEADVQERERHERLRQRRILRLGDVEFSAEAKDYPAIFRHVSNTIREDLLVTKSPARLREMPETRASRTGTGRSRGGNLQSEGMSEIQKSALGLVGETIAYIWLQHHYPDECSPASWVSSYREAIGEPPGDNLLGYDFKITLRQVTLYFEAKATTGIDMRFELGESEVTKAADCARRRRDDYRILFVTQAMDAGARKLYVLRNPMDPKYQRLYRFPGAGLVCTFNPVD